MPLDSKGSREVLSNEKELTIASWVGSTVLAHPGHPQYTADRALAKGLMVAGIDGIGSGGENSVFAAGIVRTELMQANETAGLMILPEGEAKKLLVEAIWIARDAIVEYSTNLMMEATTKTGLLRAQQSDTTVSAALVCKKDDGSLGLVTANVGDSRIYKFDLLSGELQCLTVDHSAIERRRSRGEVITKEEEVEDPQYGLVYRTVGSLEHRRDITIAVHDLNEHDIVFALTDGVTDNLDDDGLRVVIMDALKEASTEDGGFDMKKLTKIVTTRAQNVSLAGAKHSKPDDTTAAAMKVKIVS